MTGSNDQWPRAAMAITQCHSHRPSPIVAIRSTSVSPCQSNGPGVRSRRPWGTDRTRKHRRASRGDIRHRQQRLRCRQARGVRSASRSRSMQRRLVRDRVGPQERNLVLIAHDLSGSPPKLVAAPQIRASYVSRPDDSDSPLRIAGTSAYCSEQGVGPDTNGEGNEPLRDR